MVQHLPQTKASSLQAKLEKMSSEDVFWEFLNASSIETSEEKDTRNACSEVLYLRHIYDVQSLIQAKGLVGEDVFVISSRVFRNAFTRWGKFLPFDEGSVSKWLGRITINEVNTHFRTTHRALSRILELVPDNEDEEDPIQKLPAQKDDFVDGNEAGEKIAWIFSKESPLNDKEREVLRLIFVEDLSIAEVVEIVNRSEKTVRNIVTSARKKLKSIDF